MPSVNRDLESQVVAFMTADVLAWAYLDAQTPNLSVDQVNLWRTSGTVAELPLDNRVPTHQRLLVGVQACSGRLHRGI